MDTWSVWSPAGFTRSPGRLVHTDVAGAFVMTGVEPGEYRLVARPGLYGGRYLAAGYRAVRANDSGKPVVVRNGDRLQGMDIALPSGVAVEGRVLDENGEPLSLMFVVAARILAAATPRSASRTRRRQPTIWAVTASTDWSPANTSWRPKAGTR